MRIGRCQYLKAGSRFLDFDIRYCISFYSSAFVPHCHETQRLETLVLNRGIACSVMDTFYGLSLTPLYVAKSRGQFIEDCGIFRNASVYNGFSGQLMLTASVDQNVGVSSPDESISSNSVLVALRALLYRSFYFRIIILALGRIFSCLRVEVDTCRVHVFGIYGFSEHCVVGYKLCVNP